ncbi:unknown [Prevotella sp. CAG:255]|nr:unknown [Prevotella sp. CAG:255]
MGMEMIWVRPVVWGFRSILHFIIVILNIPYYIRIAETK